MREDLLGYLLSALEPHEMRRVEQELRKSSALREELEYLQAKLQPIDDACESIPVYETPPDLISRTLAALPDLAFRDCAFIDHAALLNDAHSDEWTPTIAMAPITEIRRSFRSGWSDLIVASLASVAVLALLIPNIARGRYEARKLACQDHLRQLGTAISQFVMLDNHDSLPSIAENGPEAFAGIYAVRLADHDLLDGGDLRWCPESGTPTLIGSTTEEAKPDADALIHSGDLTRASKRGNIDRLRYLQQTAGGNYAYNLGVVDGERYKAPRYEGRASFAVLGDAPISGAEFVDGVDVDRLQWSHGNNGANILFEDGSVRFMDMSQSMQFADHPFLNHRGSIEAGVNIDDASLGPSHRPPFVSVRQR